MSTLQLTIPLQATQLKAAEAEVQAGTRTIHYYASSFEETSDKHNHIVDPGAFDEWLPQFYAAGQAHPISFNHAAILDAEDPTNVVGYAPSDAEHVYVDSYGLAIKGVLNTKTEKGKAVEWQIEHGLLKGASLAMGFDMTNTERRKDGVLVIKKVDRVLESGLVPNPANQGAVLMWMKSEGMTAEATEEPYMTVAQFAATVQKQHDALVAVGAECKHEEVEVSHDEEETVDDVNAERLEELKAAAEKIANQPDSLLTEEEQERARKFRLIEASLP